eukprot:EG_transcript_210
MHADVPRVLTALLECGKDTSEPVREEVEAACVRLGLKDPTTFLRVAREFLHRNKRSMAASHRTVVLAAMQRVLHERGRELDAGDDSTADLLRFAVADMVDGAGDWQPAACALAVELCVLSPDQGGQLLLAQMPTMQLPHYFVMKALADFARASPRKFIPHLKLAMTKVLPLLSLVKQDNMKWAFATAIGRFAEAVVQYNEGESHPEPQYAVAEFGASMSTALNVVHSEWVNAKEARVRAAACEALGCLAPVVSPDVLHSGFAKIITTLSTLLKRERLREALPIIRGLQAMLETACVRAQEGVQGQLLDLWPTVHAAFCALAALPAKEQLECNKQGNELLRCAEVLARSDPDHALGFLQRQLDAKTGSKDPSSRAATLALLRHLINRLEAELAPFRDTVIATLKTALGDMDYRVRKAVLQNIIAMGPSENHYLACEGGHDLLRYVIRNASISPLVVADWDVRMAGDMSAAAAVSPGEVRSMCSNLLHVFVTSLPALDDVLWPAVLEYMGTREADGPELFHSFPAICHCIHSLAERLKGTSRFGVDYDRQVNLPRPAEMVAKFLVHVAQCDRQSREPTLSIVRAMLAIAPLLTHNVNETAVPDLWSGTVPQLLDYLKGEQFDGAKWEEVSHKLLLSTVTAKADERWAEQIGTALMAQAGAYHVRDRADYKRVAMSMLGAVVSKSTKRDFIRSALDYILEATDHTQLKLRQGCAKALGFIATAHGDAVMDKLAGLAKPSRTGSTWLSTLADLADLSKGAGEAAKATALLGYGHVVQRTPPQLMTSRLETNIVPSVLEMLGAAKTQEVKEAGLQCVDLLGRGLRKAAGLHFRSKEALLECVGQAVQPQDKAHSRNAYFLTVAGLRAMTSLLALEPRLSPDMLGKLLQCVCGVLPKVFDAPDKEAEKEKDRELLAVSRHVATLRMLEEEKPSDAEELLLRQEAGLLLCGLLDDSLTPARLQECLEALAEPLQTDAELVRERIVSCMVGLTRHFTAMAAPAAGGAGDCVGTVVGLLVPRMSDPSTAIRRMACSGIHAVLQHDHRGREGDAAQRVAELLQKLLGLRDALHSPEAKDIFGLAKQTANFLAAVLAPVQVTHVIEALLRRGIADAVDDVANGACVVLNGLVHKTGGRLADADVLQYTTAMVEAIPKVRAKENSLLGVLHCLRSLARHRVPLVCDALLGCGVPFEAHVVRAIHAVGGEAALGPALLGHLLAAMVDGPVLEEPTRRKDAEAEMSARALAAVNCLGELMDLVSGGTADHLVQQGREVRPALTSTLLLLLCVAHDVTKGVEPRGSVRGRIKSPVKQVSATLLKWLRHVYGRHANEWLRQRGLADRLAIFAGHAYAAAVPEVLQCLLAEEALLEANPADADVGPLKPLDVGPTACSQAVGQYYAFVQTYVNKPVAGYRLGATAILGQLLYHCQGDAAVVQGVMGGLLGRVAAEDFPPAKLLAVGALRHAAVHPAAVMGPFVTPVTTALLSCLGSDAPDVVRRALGTLQELVAGLEPGPYWAPLVAPICLRLRPTLDNEDGAVRGECFKVLTALCELCCQGLLDRTVMEPQMYDSLPLVLVHVNDSEVVVRQPAKQALHAVCAWLVRQSERTALRALMERPAYQVDKRMEFDEFSREFSAIWAREFLPRTAELLAALAALMRGSGRDPVKANAAILSGFLVAHLTAEGWRLCNVEQVTATLIALASTDPSALVRQKAAKALGLYPVG